MKNILALIDVKSIGRPSLTGAMIALLFAPVSPNAEALSRFCTAYGAIITYFFTKRKEEAEQLQEVEQVDAIGFDTEGE